MQIFPIINQRRRMRFIRPCVTAVLGCIMFAEALAQNAPAADGQMAISSQANADGAMASEATNKGPTYLRDIQPIFMGNCSRCHNEQTRFVYNWLDYKTAYTDRWEIKRRIWDSWKGSYYKEAMPIENSPESLALTDDQRLTIKNWVENGGIQG